MTLLDNGKVNGAQLLNEIAELLVRDHGVTVVGTVAKQWAGQPLEPADRAAIVERTDVVLTAIGDCGSCSAATIADGILLELEGIPTASICTTPFVVTGRAIARSYGLDDYSFVEAEHPVASLDRDGLRGRAETIVSDVVKILVSRQ